MEVQDTSLIYEDTACQPLLWPPPPHRDGALPKSTNQPSASIDEALPSRCRAEASIPIGTLISTSSIAVQLQLCSWEVRSPSPALLAWGEGMIPQEASGRLQEVRGCHRGDRG